MNSQLAGFGLCTLLTLGLLSSAPRPAVASDWSPLGCVVLTMPAAYDQQARSYASGVDINMIMVLLNAGISYRHWDVSGGGEVLGWDGSPVLDDETTVYLGVGFLNLLQVQAGRSRSGTSLRVRSDLVLFSGTFPMLPSLFKDCPPDGYRRCQDVAIPRGGLVLSPFVEFTPFEGNHKTVYGLGLGLLF